jgi:hypothetical protein
LIVIAHWPCRSPTSGCNPDRFQRRDVVERCRRVKHLQPRERLGDIKHRKRRLAFGCETFSGAVGEADNHYSAHNTKRMTRHALHHYAGAGAIYCPGSNIVECAADVLRLLGHNMPPVED